MNWTILTDNRSNDNRLLTEHGLSVYVETAQHKLLLDTGASDVFLRNAEFLGINLAEVDYVFISHGHSDHAGGLATFLRMNSKAQVILSPHCLDRSFYSSRNGLHSITSDWKGLDQSRLVFVTTTTQISNGIWAIVPERDRYPLPAANRHLLEGKSTDALVPDDFCHELALYADGLLFTGCAHSGLENILASAPNLPLHTVLGGFHLLDGYEHQEELLRLAYHLKVAYPDVHFYTSHCTGDTALQTLQQVLGKQMHGFTVGQHNQTSPYPEQEEAIIESESVIVLIDTIPYTESEMVNTTTESNTSKQSSSSKSSGFSSYSSYNNDEEDGVYDNIRGFDPVFVDAMVEDNNDDVKVQLDRIERKQQELEQLLNKLTDKEVNDK